MTQWNYLPALGWGGSFPVLPCSRMCACRCMFSLSHTHTHTRQTLSTSLCVYFFPLNSSFVRGQSFNGEVKSSWWNRVRNSLGVSRLHPSTERCTEQEDGRRKRWAKGGGDDNGSDETDCITTPKIVIMEEREQKGKRRARSVKKPIPAVRWVLVFSFGSVQRLEQLLVDRWGIQSWQKLIDDFLTVTHCND